MAQLAVAIPVFTGKGAQNLASLCWTLASKVRVVDDQCWVPQVLWWPVKVQVVVPKVDATHKRGN